MVVWSSLATPSGLHLLAEAVTMVSVDILLQVVSCALVVAIYRKQLASVLAIYSANPPCIGCPALDAAPFQLFMKSYNMRCYYNMLASLAAILSITMYMNAEQTSVEVEGHFVLRALAVLSMTNLLSGLLLSVLFVDTFTQVSASYSNTLTWVEDAKSMSSSWLSMPIVLAAPFTSTVSGIISLMLYRIASAVMSMIDPENIGNRSEGNAELYVAMGVVAYMALVVVHTAVTAKTFLSTKTPDFVLPAGSIALVLTP